MIERIISTMSEKDWIIMLFPIMSNLLIDGLLLYFVQKSFERTLRRKEKQEDHIAALRGDFSSILIKADRCIISYKISKPDEDENSITELINLKNCLVEAAQFYKMNQMALLFFEEKFYSVISDWEDTVAPKLKQMTATDFSLSHIVQVIPPPIIPLRICALLLVELFIIQFFTTVLELFFQIIIFLAFDLIFLVPFLKFMARSIDNYMNSHLEVTINKALHLIAALFRWRIIKSTIQTFSTRISMRFLGFFNLNSNDTTPLSTDDLNNALKEFDEKLAELINEIQSNLYLQY